MMRAFFLLLFLSLGFLSNAQKINPEQDEIFNPNEIAKVYLTLTDADKDQLLHEDNRWSNTYFSSTMRFVNSTIDTEVPQKVGIRIRGNTSRNQPKLSFKLKFNLVSGDKFYGHKKFNLKAETNDPSMTRELMTLHLMREMNVPAARSHHVELYLNDEYMGLYLNVEQIDDEFLDTRYDTEEGNLYKCSWGATLLNNDDIYDNGMYELKTNEEVNDRSKLKRFVEVLNSPTATDFPDKLEEVFEVDAYLRQLAVEVISGHWDGYAYNQNNYYLFENPVTNKMEFIPYDVDNSFGIDWIGRDWGTRDVLDWVKHGDPRPLATYVLYVDKYFNQFQVNIDLLLNNFFNEDYLFPKFDFYQSLLEDAVQNDTYYPQHFGFSVSTFLNSFSYKENGDTHLDYGLKSYVSTRASTARDQLGDFVVTSTDNPFFSEIRLYPNPSNGGWVYISSHSNLIDCKLFNSTGAELAFELSQVEPFVYRLDYDLSAGVYLLMTNGTVRRLMVR